MKKMFDHRPKRLERCRTFEDRMWLKNEPFTQYYQNDIAIGNQVPFDEDEILDYLIDGIPDVNLRNQARMRGFGSASELLKSFSKISLTVETMISQSKSEPKPADSKAAGKTNADGRSSKKSVLCYNCKKPGHTARYCRLPKKQECFNSRDSRHVVKDYPFKKAGINFVDEFSSLDDRFFRIIVVTLGKGKRLDIECVLDSSSPISFIKINCIPNKAIERATEIDSRYAGINQLNLLVLGKIHVSIVLNGETCNDLKLLVVPDKASSLYGVYPLVYPRPALSFSFIITFSSEKVLYSVFYKI